MWDQLVEALKGHKADYTEAHLEESQSTHIIYRSGRLEEVNRTGTTGGNIRALVRGGWGFVSFSHLDKLRDKVALAVSEARLAGREEFELSAMEPVVDTVTQFHPHLNPLPSRERRNSASVSLAIKKELLDEYNDIMLSSPRIQNSRIDYHDTRRKVIFANSEGSYIEQSKPDLSLRLTAIARENNEVQQAGLSLGSKGDFSAIEGLHDQVREVARRAAAPLVLAAEFAKWGINPRVTDAVAQALSQTLSMAKERDLICVIGSLFVVAEALDYAASHSNF